MRYRETYFAVWCSSRCCCCQEWAVLYCVENERGKSPFRFFNEIQVTSQCTYDMHEELVRTCVCLCVCDGEPHVGRRRSCPIWERFLLYFLFFSSLSLGSSFLLLLLLLLLILVMFFFILCCVCIYILLLHHAQMLIHGLTDWAAWSK